MESPKINAADYQHLAALVANKLQHETRNRLSLLQVGAYALQTKTESRLKPELRGAMFADLNEFIERVSFYTRILRIHEISVSNHDLSATLADVVESTMGLCAGRGVAFTNPGRPNSIVGQCDLHLLRAVIMELVLTALPLQVNSELSFSCVSEPGAASFELRGTKPMEIKPAFSGGISSLKSESPIGIPLCMVACMAMGAQLNVTPFTLGIRLQAP